MQQIVTKEITSFGGTNDALNPAELPDGVQRRAYNAIMRSIGTLGKRDGSVPVTTSALSTIKHLADYQFNNSVAVGAAPTLSAVGNAASTLPAATYYVRYTYVTDVGETEASAEASVVVPPAVANPTLAPVLAQSTDAGETLPDTTYYIAHTWKNAVGETMVSPEASILITAGNRLDITIPSLPSGATSASIYAGTVSGTLYYQSNITGTTTFINAPILTVTAPPASNTCIVANLRVVVPAIPYHANSINIYISTSTNTEKKEVNTTNTTYNQTVPLTGTIAYPTANTTAFSAELLASAGTSLYGYYNGELRSATMTNALESSDIYTVAFTNISNTSILFITDGGDVKQYNGSAVANITPAADDALPNPPNDLVNINAKNPIYCWVYSSHVFITDGKDIVWYSKRFHYDYFPSVQYERWVRDNDYITGPGMAFNNVCLMPMRRGWGMLTGSTVDNFDGNQFINTVNGCIAPRSPKKITYPDGGQTIAYLSDDGVHEIYDTGSIDTGSRQYSTRSLMKEKIDFNAIGFTEAEKEAAEACFDQNFYILTIKQGANNYAYVYDTRNREWYVWTNIKAETLIRYNNILYYAGSTGLLHKFDESLYTDWNESAKTTGTAVDFDVYSGMISFEFSGYESYLDYYLVEAKQWTVPSTLDVYIIYGAGTINVPSALKNEIFIWGVSSWGEAQWANLDFTDILNNSNELIFHKKGKYFQRRWRNNRDEPVLILKERYKGRLSGR